MGSVMCPASPTFFYMTRYKSRPASLVSTPILGSNLGGIAASSSPKELFAAPLFSASSSEVAPPPAKSTPKAPDVQFVGHGARGNGPAAHLAPEKGGCSKSFQFQEPAAPETAHAGASQASASKSDSLDVTICGVSSINFGVGALKSYQLSAVKSILSKRNCMVVQQTGSGKSLCIYLPSLVTGKTTIVLCPTIALMQTQLSHLKEKGISAAVWGGGQSPEVNKESEMELQAGRLRILLLLY